jgi:Ni/Fe-hydrogenase subunit HybB-like protein
MDESLLHRVEGFMYPNEMELQWSVLILLYPFITGLVAGAFILASLERIFRVEAVKPTYRLALLTALAFWLDYRHDIVLLARRTPGALGRAYKWLTLGSDNISPRALRADERVGWFITLVGIPSAFLLHGYVGFIFGSIKANPWWSTPLMPIVFLFSAIVSGIALVMLVYMLASWLTGREISMPCVDTIARYLLYAFVIDFSLELLDLLHRIYEADESFKTLDFMVHTRLYTSQVIVQIVAGTVIPIGLLALTQIVRLSDAARRGVYTLAGLLTLLGIFAMRWNVVIGGQLFSKSYLGYTTYKMEFATREGLLPAVLLMALPFLILWGLVRLLPPWHDTPEPATEQSWGGAAAGSGGARLAGVVEVGRVAGDVAIEPLVGVGGEVLVELGAVGGPGLDAAQLGPEAVDVEPGQRLELGAIDVHRQQVEALDADVVEELAECDGLDRDGLVADALGRVLGLRLEAGEASALGATEGDRLPRAVAHREVPEQAAQPLLLPGLRVVGERVHPDAPPAEPALQVERVAVLDGPAAAHVDEVAAAPVLEEIADDELLVALRVEPPLAAEDVPARDVLGCGGEGCGGHQRERRQLRHLVRSSVAGAA